MKNNFRILIDYVPVAIKAQYITIWAICNLLFSATCVLGCISTTDCNQTAMKSNGSNIQIQNPICISIHIQCQ